ncbi:MULTISPECIES: DUF333 domain-containing protein [Photobacterium]|uniref:Hemolysin n=1 Tax=Photobacterium halotolerans TaxID=265726 RepID=A0A0F5VFU4_9GAMM|nr:MULTISPECIES: DUF333 domain-containing protein [Photobacterium]KKD00933.1 hemolysin [Photobacterium halotolerans]UIP29027.1 DUF333 domain-containing protein [Photobacterium sp. TLY01]
MNKTYLLACAAAASLLLGCVSQPASEPVGSANPAAVYCVQKGGKLDMVTEDGKRVTYCVLSDGRRVEQWQYFRDNHPQVSEAEGM